jgi:hypothetical protein
MSASAVCRLAGVDLERDHWICLTAAAFLERVIFGGVGTAELVDVPELTDTTSAGQRIELLARVADDVVGLEHTILESYPNQIGDGFRIMKFVDTVRGLLAGGLPNGLFTLTVATTALQDITGSKQQAVAEETAAWVEKAATELVEEAEVSGGRQMTDPLPARLMFRRSNESHDLRFGRFVPDGLEELRAEKLATSFGTKLPKLATYGEDGVRTCLVLEVADISLGNPHELAEAGNKVMAEFRGLEPTWIVVAETWPQTAFWSVLYADGGWCEPESWQDSEIPIDDPTPLSIGEVVTL